MNIKIRLIKVCQSSTYNSSRCRCDNTIFMIRCGLDAEMVEAAYTSITWNYEKEMYGTMIDPHDKTSYIK